MMKSKDELSCKYGEANYMLNPIEVASMLDGASDKIKEVTGLDDNVITIAIQTLLRMHDER